MPCPFFEPRFVIETGPWTHRPRLPLGDAFSGVCHAAPEPYTPASNQLDRCNHGYARGICGNFPASCAADAVRFSVISIEPVRIVYILEKDHAPLEHGEADSRLLLPNATLGAQARAFLSQILTRFEEPKGA